MAAAGRALGAGGRAAPSEEDERVAQALEQAVLEMEDRVLGRDRERLREWSQGQQDAFDRAGEQDGQAIAAQRQLLEDCERSIQQELNAIEDERELARLRYEDQHAEFEDCAREALSELGSKRAGHVSEVVTGAARELEACRKKWEDEEWRQFESRMQTVLWKHVRGFDGGLHTNDAATQGMLESWDPREMQQVLEEEKDGWLRSQRGDLERLSVEIASTLDPLEARLQELAPVVFLEEDAGPQQQLVELANASKARVAQIYQEVTARFGSEIAAAVAECEDEYESFDAELERVLLQAYQERARSAADMQKLQLAMCRWRLDYQRAFHEHCSTLGLRPPPTEDPGARGEERRAAEAVQAKVLALWEQSRVPSQEMERFLERAVDAAVVGGMAEPVIEAYEEELRAFGANALLNCAGDRDQLDALLEALDGRGRRPSEEW